MPDRAREARRNARPLSACVRIVGLPSMIAAPLARITAMPQSLSLGIIRSVVAFVALAYLPE